MNNSIGKRIQMKRKQLELSESTIVKQCKIKSEKLNDWENDEFIPEGSDLYKLSKALFTHPYFIIYGNESDDVEMNKLGHNLVPILIVMSVIISTYIIFTGLNYLSSSATVSMAYAYISQGFLIFCFLYWMASMLKSSLETRNNIEKLLYETRKLNMIRE